MNAIQIITSHLKDTGKIDELVLWKALHENYEFKKQLSSWYWVKHEKCRDVVKYSLEGRPKLSYTKFKKYLASEPSYRLTEDFKRYCDEVLIVVIDNVLSRGLLQDIDAFSSDDWRIAMHTHAYRVQDW